MRIHRVVLIIATQFAFMCGFASAEVPSKPGKPVVELLEKLPEGKINVELVGDVANRSSVSAGNVLANLGDVKVFPGAEGFGTDTIAGRGGAVCKVVNLSDAGPGSFRACVEKVGPRIVIFDVGGTITLSRSIVVRNPFISIYGQTALGDGILVRMSLNSADTPFKISTHDVLVQHMRFRAGSSSQITCCRDAAGVQGDGVNNVVLDHNSMSWGTDQIANTWYGVRNVTFSYNIISESLHDNGSADQGPGGRGFLVGSKGAGNISIHHNFFAHSYERNPLIKADGTVDVVSNLVYHWVSRAGQHYSQLPNLKVNWVKNKWIAKTNYSDSSQNSQVAWGDIEIKEMDYPVRAYFEGNIGHNRPTNDLPEWAIANTFYERPYEPSLGYHTEERFPSARITETAAEDLERKLSIDVGATLPKRDSVDQRLMVELKARSGKMPNCVSRSDRSDSRCENNVGGWPTMNGGLPRQDTDGDGIPDEWEVMYGLNPDRPNAAEDANGDGYTDIESWVHSIN